MNGLRLKLSSLSSLLLALTKLFFVEWQEMEKRKRFSKNSVHPPVTAGSINTSIEEDVKRSIQLKLVGKIERYEKKNMPLLLSFSNLCELKPNKPIELGKL